MSLFDTVECPVTAQPVETTLRLWLDRLGPTFAIFDLQDSGCVSYGITNGESRWFVKTSTTTPATQSLHRALTFHAHVRHEAIIAPVAAFTFPDATVALIYPWADGQVLYPTTTLGAAIRRDPSGPMTAFRALPVQTILAALDTILQAHHAVTAAGFVAVDLYDGCFLYDFDHHLMRLVDLDEYRPGPFTTVRRLPGSTRFMAPEETGSGAVIDERTTVYNLGRTIRLLLDGTDTEQAWRGTNRQLEVVAVAADPDPDRRYPTTEALQHAWSQVAAIPAATNEKVT